jgi:murein L,D-transpeptidase YcbB/YkuD
MKIFRLILFFFFWVCALAACSDMAQEAEKKQPGQDSISPGQLNDAESVAGNFSNPSSLYFDSSALDDFLKKYPGFLSYATELKKFYTQRNYSYAWYDEDGIIEQAASLFNRFEQLEQEGLQPDKFPYLDQFNSLMEGNDSSLQTEPMNAEAELMLTAQYLSYAHQVWQGMPEKESRKLEWFLPRKKLSLQNLMDSLLLDANHSFIEQEPVYRQYFLLKNYLQKYRDIEKAGGWGILKGKKKLYKKGDSSQFVVQLRRRLFITGDLANDTSSLLFDDELENAVKNFQQRNGWKEDGIAGSSVIRGLNIPVDQLIEKILVNMERCRWVPANPQGEYLVVNVPAFKLYAFKNDSVLFDMNIVAGEPLHKTVLFNGDLKYIVFSPYWNVPPGILKKEILPGIKKDPLYLEKHNMEWYGNTVRQKPGPNNSLGKVKFLFPNSFNIYLHDTPAKNLFAEDRRAFSHGCIRLAEPKKLAMYLLRNYPGWTEEKIDEAMNAGKEKYVTLRETIPLFITYFTAWVDRNGKLNTRQDVYNRDKRIARMILEKN